MDKGIRHKGVTMKSGQFYHGKIGGIQKHFESPDLGKILPSDKLCELADYNEIGEHSRFFKAERVLAQTEITEAENSDGRRGGVVNRTVMHKFDYSCPRHETAQYSFDVDAFVAEI